MSKDDNKPSHAHACAVCDVPVSKTLSFDVTNASMNMSA